MGKVNPGGARRSEVERKKHAGWRECPSCRKQVSSNGRNFFHHLNKCDPSYLARNPTTAPARTGPVLSASPVTPARPFNPAPSVASAPISGSLSTLQASSPSVPSPLTPGHPHATPRRPPRPYPAASVSPPAYPSSQTFLDTQVEQPRPDRALTVADAPPFGDYTRVTLTEEQYSSFIQQLCFLRTYDRTVNDAFDRLERSCGGKWGAFNAEIFAEVAAIQRAHAVAPDFSPPQTLPPSPITHPVDSRHQFYPHPSSAPAPPFHPHEPIPPKLSPASPRSPPANSPIAGASNLVAFARAAHASDPAPYPAVSHPHRLQPSYHKHPQHQPAHPPLDCPRPTSHSHPNLPSNQHYDWPPQTKARSHTPTTSTVPSKAGGSGHSREGPLHKSPALSTSMSISNVLD